MGQPYADIEELIGGWLSQACGCRVLTDLPADLQQQVPLLQINRYGGADVAPGLDVALLDVDAFGPDRSTAVTYAERARRALRFDLPNTQIGYSVFTQVLTIEAPSYRPYDNTDLRRIGATYRLTIHNVAA